MLERRFDIDVTLTGAASNNANERTRPPRRLLLTHFSRWVQQNCSAPAPAKSKASKLVGVAIGAAADRYRAASEPNVRAHHDVRCNARNGRYEDMNGGLAR
jgi:hypothetical protein